MGRVQISIRLRARPLPSNLCCNAAQPARFLLPLNRLMGATEGDEMANGTKLNRLQGEHRV
jgi:hypothetical protein